MIITIFVSDESKIDKVLNKMIIPKNLKHNIRTTNEVFMMDSKENEIKIIVARDGVRGMRHNYVFIDKDINSELVECVIIPKVIPIYTIFGAVGLERYYEFIDIDYWNGRISIGE